MLKNRNIQLLNLEATQKVASKLLLFLGVVICTINGNAQTYFNKAFNLNNTAELGVKILLSEHGSIFIVSSDYNGTLIVSKLNESGDTIWNQITASDTSIESYVITSAIIIGDTSILVTGATLNSDSSTTLATVWSLDTTGNLNWSKQYNIGFVSTFFNLELLKEENILLSGTSRSSGIHHPYLVKIDLQGNFIWERKITNFVNGGILRSLKELEDGTLFGAGNTYGAWWEGFIYKMDSSGFVEWTKTYTGGDGNGGFYKMELDSSNNLILVGSMAVEYSGFQLKADAFVWKIDNTGGVVWEKSFGGPYSEEFVDVDLDPQGNIVVAGTNSSINAQYDTSGLIEDPEGWIMKLSLNGVQLWERFYSHSINEHDYIWDLDVDSTGTIRATGSSHVFTQDLWYLQLDCCGCDSVLCAFSEEENCGIDTTGVSNYQMNDDQLVLYPNPTENSFRLLLDNSVWLVQVLVQVYDVQGRIIHEQNVNQNEVINLDRPEGLYLVKVSDSKGRSKVETLILK